VQLLLISNGGVPPYEHCRKQIASFVGPNRRVAFVTAARLGDETAYFDMARRQLVDVGALSELVHLQWDGDWDQQLSTVDDVFVGGGNTYVLVKRLTESGLLDGIRAKLDLGASYVGSSAGSNLAGPNIQTTNDWNVVGQTSFTGLGVVPFNVNPHYVERASTDGPTGESRDDRIAEYLMVHDNPVVALEEGALLVVADGTATVGGTRRARVFVRGHAPRWVEPGETLGLDGP
jgi:dipeptidase E